MPDQAMRWKWVAVALTTLLFSSRHVRGQAPERDTPPLATILYGTSEPFETPPTSRQTLIDEAFSLGCFAFESKSYGDAEQSFRLVVHEADRLATQDDRYVEAMIWLAVAEANQEKAWDAVRDGGRALRLVKKAPDSKNLRWAAALNALGRAMERAGVIRHPYRCYYYEMMILKNQFGPSHVRVAERALNLARLAAKYRNDVRAEALERQALAVFEMSGPAYRSGTARSLNYLGTSCRKQGKLAEAESCFRRASLIQEDASPTEDRMLAISLTRLGHVILVQGRVAEAEPLLDRAIELFEKVKAPISSCQPFANYLKAQILEDRMKTAEAERCYRVALECVEKICGVDDPALLIYLDKISGLLRRQGRSLDAEQIERRARTIREQNPRETDWTVSLRFPGEKIKHFSEGDDLKWSPLPILTFEVPLVATRPGGERLPWIRMPFIVDKMLH